MTAVQETYETVYVRRRFLAKRKIDGENRSSLPEYRIWTGMIARCANPKHKSFKRYGGRGVTVCARWAQDFENFYRDMGPRPSAKHSIDRIENAGNYEPSNCRWATPREQVLNRGGGSATWTDKDVDTLTRMYLGYRSVEDIAVALDRSVATIRLRIHKFGLRREGHITRLIKKHGDLAPILAERGKEEFLAAVDEKIALRISRAKRSAPPQKSEIAAKIAEILATEGSRNDKIRLMRLEGFSLSRIGRVFGITRERVRQIENEGFRNSGEHAVGAARKISRTNEKTRRVKIHRLCRAWNKASREARLMFLQAAPDALFDSLTVEQVERAAPASEAAA